MKASLYEIPPGCICMGDGLFGMKCEAQSHAKLKSAAPPVFDELVCLHCGERFLACVCFEEEGPK